MSKFKFSLVGFVDLPAHVGAGGFDHAAIHLKSRQLYVAHTANDTLDVIDLRQNKYSHSISGLKGIAGALVSNERDLVFTSNRNEDTVSIFNINQEMASQKIPVGHRPNGLAYDSEKNILLVGNVGAADRVETYTLSLVNVVKRTVIQTIPVAGRTRWAIFDEKTNSFYVNLGKPAQILVIPSDGTQQELRSFEVPGEGPHGLDLDYETGRLFCACDGRQLVALDKNSGKTLHLAELSGSPDVIFFNAHLNHLYVAIGDPGVIDIFDTKTMQKLATVETEKGAHTIAFDVDTNHVYAFLPRSHRAAVFLDS